MKSIKHTLLLFATLWCFVGCGKDNPSGQEGSGTDPDPASALIFSHDFTRGLGSFTIKDVNMGKYTEKVWKFDSSNAKYGAQASAGTGYAVECWLVSPEIDLSKYREANLYFNHAFAYIKSGNPQDYFGIKVSSDGGSTCGWCLTATLSWPSPAISPCVPSPGRRSRSLSFTEAQAR